MKKELIITGIRGVPASHGGFETFAENLAVYLVDHGWHVTVYCQESVENFVDITETEWQGVRRIHIPVNGSDAKATVLFDYLSVKHASKQPGLVLTLGYNTAIFNLLFRLKGKKNIINMDGIEWRRDKWALYERAWLYFNERLGCLIGHHLIADHPEIKKHLTTRVNESKVTTIAYGARSVDEADQSLLFNFNLKANGYCVVIARPEPENSILEIVKAFSQKKRNCKLVVLGKYDDSNEYHKAVLNSASDEVLFVGAIYDHASLDAIRFFARLYIHGHTVGGTNPSLIEALGAGQAVLAHNNKFNCWVAGDMAVFFEDQYSCANKLDELLENSDQLMLMSKFSKDRFNSMFTWRIILQQYENLLFDWVSDAS